MNAMLDLITIWCILVGWEIKGKSKTREIVCNKELVVMIDVVVVEIGNVTGKEIMIDEDKGWA